MQIKSIEWASAIKIKKKNQRTNRSKYLQHRRKNSFNLQNTTTNQ